MISWEDSFRANPVTSCDVILLNRNCPWDLVGSRQKSSETVQIVLSPTKMLGTVNVQRIQNSTFHLQLLNSKSSRTLKFGNTL